MERDSDGRRPGRQPGDAPEQDEALRPSRKIKLRQNRTAGLEYSLQAAAQRVFSSGERQSAHRNGAERNQSGNEKGRGPHTFLPGLEGGEGFFNACDERPELRQPG